MKRLLPDLRNARAGIEPKRLAKADAANKPLGLRIVNDATDPSVTELWLYEEIGMWGISAQDVIDALAEVDTPTVRVRINSPGGDVFDGIAISNALASYNGTVTGVIDSLCASIATVIAMACEHITMSPGSQMMIHPASGVCFGDAADMQQMADLLAFQTNNIAGLYASRAGGTSTEWLAKMQATTWMTADEAVASGLADETGVVKQSGKSVTPAGMPSWDEMWDLSVYRIAAHANQPERPNGTDESTTACSCGPKGWTVAHRDGQHLDACPARGALTPRPVNLPSPAGVQWEVVPFDGCCGICQEVVDASPYPEDDLPEVPVHPNCDCELQVAYGVDNHASSTTAVEAEFDTELFRSTLREVFA